MGILGCYIIFRIPFLRLFASRESGNIEGGGGGLVTVSGGSTVLGFGYIRRAEPASYTGRGRVEMCVSAFKPDINKDFVVSFDREADLLEREVSNESPQRAPMTMALIMT